MHTTALPAKAAEINYLIIATLYQNATSASGAVQ